MIDIDTESPTSDVSTGSTAVPSRRGLERNPSLDGLRAIAVVAVVVYHADHNLLPGGFIGVDLFFVLSGYLITTLLVAEHDRTGRIGLGSFWARRMRRLWPSAWVTLAAIAVASLAGVWGADRQRTVPAELGAAFAHIANWYQAAHDGYIGQFAAPSPVRHYWSLAIEEQFYLVWPVVVAGVLELAARSCRFGRWAMPVVLLILGAGSIAMGFHFADAPDRAYLGTDVRAVALVVGAAMAWWWRERPFSPPERWRAAFGSAGAVALGAFVGAAFVVEPDASWLPRGGFAAVAVGCAVLVAGALANGPLSSVLALGPVVHLGRISFVLYLVHWPLIVAIGPGRPLWLRLVVALPVSIAIAELMHRVVELPVLERRVPKEGLAAGLVGAIAVSVAALVIAVPDGRTPTEQVAADLDVVPDPTLPATTSPTSIGAGTVSNPADGEPTLAPATTACVPLATPGSAFEGGDGFDPSTVEEIADPSGAGCDGQVDVLVVGDSTGRGAANGLSNLGNPSIRVWDRTDLGCSLGGETCPDWRVVWAEAVSTIRPDVVVVYAGVVSDLNGVDDAPFLSTDAGVVRKTVLGEAVATLSSSGAKVLLTTVAVPLRPKGLFFCKGDGTDTNCDPDWVATWNGAILGAAAERGAQVLNVAQWIDSRDGGEKDRPDGLHLAGSALVEHARWLVPQLVSAAAGS